MAELNMLSDISIRPEIIVFGDSNGSGKTTITKMALTVGKYITQIR